MSDTAIRCEGVTKRFDDLAAVESISFELKRGRLLSLLGPSGCGKTTTLRMIAGFETPDEGEIAVGGTVVAGSGVNLPPEKRRVGMVFQDYALFPHMDLAANVAYAMAKRKKGARTVGDLLELVGLSHLRSRMPHELSGGEQQRGALARSLAAEPEVILLDEPFSNLDAVLRAQVRADVREILRAAGATAVFVTHDLEEALSIADEVAVMFKGRIVQIGTPEVLYNKPGDVTIAAWLGDANFLPGESAGGRVQCELGTLDIPAAADGAVQVMLRPEWISLRPDPAGRATVDERVFYGHDQIVGVRLASGARIKARIWSSGRFEPGERVEVVVHEGAVAYKQGNGRLT